MSSLKSDWLSCSDLGGDFNVAGLEVFLSAFENIYSRFWFNLKKFVWPVAWVCAILFGCGRLLLLFWILGSSMRMLGVFSAVAASDFGAGEFIFVVSSAAAPCTRRYCFLPSFHCVPISRTCLTALWSFMILIHFSFLLVLPGFLWISVVLFPFNVNRSGIEVVFLFLSKLVFECPWGHTLYLFHC